MPSSTCIDDVVWREQSAHLLTLLPGKVGVGNWVRLQKVTFLWLKRWGCYVHTQSKVNNCLFQIDWLVAATQRRGAASSWFPQSTRCSEDVNQRRDWRLRRKLSRIPSIPSRWIEVPNLTRYLREHSGVGKPVCWVAPLFPRWRGALAGWQNVQLLKSVQ